MLCDFLDLEGWQTIFLGASVPTESLIGMIAQKQPEAVALSATIAPHLPQLRSTISEIRAAAGERQPVILVGGRPCLDQPELARHVGADLTASDASGNQASAFKEYEVTKSHDVLTQIIDMLSKIPRYFQNLFGLVAPS